MLIPTVDLNNKTILLTGAAGFNGSRWCFIKGNIADKELIRSCFAENKFQVVVNLEAQAGVRYSITNPDAYIESNLIGFYTIYPELQ